MHMRRIIFLAILVLALSSLPAFTVAKVLAQQDTKPSVWVKIHRIQAIDPIESFLDWGGPHWHYYIYVWDGDEWLTEDGTASGVSAIVDLTFSFTVETVVPTMEIKLLEDDSPLSASDVADISSYPGGGPDDTNFVPRGALYRAIYTLKTDELDGDTIILETGYWKTSGDYDDSITTDQNDANLWFRIWDNYDAPVADAGEDTECYTGDKVNFDGSGSTASGGSSIVKFEWDFENDGIIDAEGGQTSYTYQQRGLQTCRLRVTDSMGEWDEDTCFVNVLNRAPNAEFTYSPTDPSIQAEINFVDTSSDPDGTITSWLWDFGDGNTSTLQSPTYIFSQKGNHDVTLTVTDNDGAETSAAHTVEVINLPPEAFFECTPTNPRTSSDVQFTDKSTDPENIPLTSWLWDFGDGYTSEIQTPTHQFVSKGNFEIVLTVWDDENATSTFSMMVSVTEPPPSEAAIPIPLWIVTLVVIVLIAITISGIYVWTRRRRSNKA